MNPFAMLAVDIYTWFYWQAVWIAQRLTRYLMPYCGLKAGFRFGKFQVKEIGWHQWGYYRLYPQIIFSDGSRIRESQYEQFSWVTTQKFLESCAFDVDLPDNCVWVTEEQGLS